MQAFKSHAMQRAGSVVLSALLAFPTFALAQDAAPPPPPTASDSQSVPAPDPSLAPPPATGGWRRVGDQATANQTTSNQSSPDNSVQPAPAAPPYTGTPMQTPQGAPPQAYPQPAQPAPTTLTVPAGTYLTVRINQLLSSDRNQVGDAFSATLVKPLVINGVVVAEPGETIGGHVVEAVKAGRVSGLARLGVQLTDLTLVDGQQLPIKSSLINRTGPSSGGQDAGTIIGTTALGAAVGAAAGWGKGAAIGAGSGLVLGVVGVLVTRGHPSILYPEQMLTFRCEAPLTIDTTHAPQAFHYVAPGEYSQPDYGQQPGPYGQQLGTYGPYTAAPYPAYPPVAAAPGPYYYGYPYPYYAYGYPYYWGPGFSFFGGRYYGGYGGYRGYYGGGYHGYYGGVGHSARGGSRR